MENKILHRADDKYQTKKKTRKGGYEHTEWKPRLGLGGSSSNKMSIKERRAEL
jgi:hypothetical protein